MKKSARIAEHRIDWRQWRRARRYWFGALYLMLTFAPPALAEEPVRIGVGYGLSFLLVEKHGKEGRLDLRLSY